MTTIRHHNPLLLIQDQDTEKRLKIFQSIFYQIYGKKVRNNKINELFLKKWAREVLCEVADSNDEKSAIIEYLYYYPPDN